MDDLFLISHTIYDKSKLIVFIRDVVSCFQKENPKLINLNFKFGNGVLPLAIELLRQLFNSFNGRQNMKVFLIDESKSSKSKFKDKNRRVRTKHEVSALILSLRKGFEVNKTNLFKVFKPNKKSDSIDDKENTDKNYNQIDEKRTNLQSLIEKILNNEISLSDSYDIFQKNIIW